MATSLFSKHDGYYKLIDQLEEISEIAFVKSRAKLASTKKVVAEKKSRR